MFNEYVKDYFAMYCASKIVWDIFPSPDDSYIGWQKKADRLLTKMRDQIYFFILDNW